MALIPVCETLTRIQDKAFSTIKLPVAEEKTEDLRKSKKKNYRSEEQQAFYNVIFHSFQTVIGYTGIPKVDSIL